MGGGEVVTLPTHYPLSAVVGADEAKLALILAALDPAIGGVLMRGEKGSAKSTLARGVAALLPGDASFVELPVGATEDRLVGSLDLAEALTGGATRLRPGLLAAAHRGVLYVDEVNLLPDHLVDALLDVAASGVNRVEREGVAHAHPARFVLIGSMNPEEGELRPQLLDRFGLCVDVGASTDPAVRARAVRRRLAFDASPAAAAEEWQARDAELRDRVAAVLAAGTAPLTDEVIESVSSLCVSVGAEGLRADLVICRAAAALAAWEQRSEVTVGDVRRVAPLALAHRARRHPLDPHGMERDDLEREMDRALGGLAAPPMSAGDPAGAGESAGGGDPAGAGDPAGGGDPAGAGDPETATMPDRPAPTGTAVAVSPLRGPRTVSAGGAAGRRSMAEGPRGRLVGDRLPGPAGPATLALGATVRAAAARRATSGGPTIVATDVREAVREQRRGNLVVIAVDASGSMGVAARMTAAKSAVLGLLVDAYQRRDRVSLVTFRDHDAEIVLRPTASVEVAKARLSDLATGGRTPLAAGLLAALQAATSETVRTHPPLIVIVTDGRATSAPDGLDPWEAVRVAADSIRRRRIPVVVVDVEEGSTRLGLAAELAEAAGGRVLTLAELTGPSLVTAVRHAQQWTMG